MCLTSPELSTRAQSTPNTALPISQIWSIKPSVKNLELGAPSEPSQNYLGSRLFTASPEFLLTCPCLLQRAMLSSLQVTQEEETSWESGANTSGSKILSTQHPDLCNKHLEKVSTSRGRDWRQKIQVGLLVWPLLLWAHWAKSQLPVVGCAGPGCRVPSLGNSQHMCLFARGPPLSFWNPLLSVGTLSQWSGGHEYESLTSKSLGDNLHSGAPPPQGFVWNPLLGALYPVLPSPLLPWAARRLTLHQSLPRECPKQSRLPGNSTKRPVSVQGHCAGTDLKSSEQNIQHKGHNRKNLAKRRVLFGLRRL